MEAARIVEQFGRRELPVLQWKVSSQNTGIRLSIFSRYILTCGFDVTVDFFVPAGDTSDGCNSFETSFPEPNFEEPAFRFREWDLEDELVDDGG